jgi:cytoskeletal protein RodZ
MFDFDSPMVWVLLIVAVLMLALLLPVLLLQHRRRVIEKQELRFKKVREREKQIWNAHLASHEAAAQQTDKQDDTQH